MSLYYNCISASFFVFGVPYLHLSPCTQQGEEAAKVGAIKATIFAEPDLANLTEPVEGYLVSSVSVTNCSTQLVLFQC